MADKLIKIRRAFVDKASLALVKQLLDDLLEDKILNDGEKEAILDENPSKTDKARCLIDIVKKKGNKASNSLITHLEERDPSLFSELGLSSAEQPAQTALPQVYQDAMASEMAPIITMPTQDAKGCEMPLKLSTDVFKKEKLTDPKIYPVREKSSRNRLALMITNVEFDLPGMKRNGADKDEENMLMLLNELGYDVVKHRNLSGQEMDLAVEKFSQDPRLYGTDSVFVVIMSHGNLGVIEGIHWTPKNHDVLQIEKIYTHLNTVNCPALLNKPKVIIIQACRGGNDGSTIVHDDDISCDAYLDTEDIEDDGSFRAHKEKDFISLLSCTPDTVSYRSKVTGSFLIKFIVETFHKSAHEDHIEELFTEVMSSFEGSSIGGTQKKQMPVKDRCSLTKKFYLFPGY